MVDVVDVSCLKLTPENRPGPKKDCFLIVTGSFISRHHSWIGWVQDMMPNCRESLLVKSIHPGENPTCQAKKTCWKRTIWYLTIDLLNTASSQNLRGKPRFPLSAAMDGSWDPLTAKTNAIRAQMVSKAGRGEPSFQSWASKPAPTETCNSRLAVCWLEDVGSWRSRDWQFLRFRKTKAL